MTTQAAKDKEIKEGKFFAVISYISFLCIISLVLKKDNPFALYHAKQGLVLFVMEVVCFLISIVPFLGWLLVVMGFVIFPIFSALGIFQALMGNNGRLPIVSDIADNIVL